MRVKVIYVQSLLSESEKSEIKISVEHFDKSYEDIECSSYEYQISTGKLIIIILQSMDGEILDSFIMNGIGELKYFKPYGNFFK